MTLTARCGLCNDLRPCPRAVKELTYGAARDQGDAIKAVMLCGGHGTRIRGANELSRKPRCVGTCRVFEESLGDAASPRLSGVGSRFYQSG